MANIEGKNENENLFLKGSYIPLKVTGEFRKNIIAFLRSFENDHLLVVLAVKHSQSSKRIYTGKIPKLNFPHRRQKNG